MDITKKQKSAREAGLKHPLIHRDPIYKYLKIRKKDILQLHCGTEI